MHLNKLIITFFAIALLALGSSAVLAQNGPPPTVPPVPTGPLAVSATGGGCERCVCPFPPDPLPEPCTKHCSIPLKATIVNRLNKWMVVQVTLSTSIPSVPDFCGNYESSRVDTYYIPGKQEIEIDFGQSYTGLLHGTFSVHAEILDCELPVFIGKTADAGAGFGTVWMICPDCPF